MKQNLIILFSFLIVFPLSAQKAKVKDQKVQAKYLSLPQIGFDKDVSVYNVDVKADQTALTRLGYTKSSVANATQIKSYTRIEEAIGPKVTLELDGPGGTPLKLNSDKKQNKEGKKWTEYSYSVTFNGNMLVKVKAEDGTLLFEDAIAKSSTETTGKFRSVAELKKNFDSSKFYLSNRTALLKDILKSASASLNSNFGYAPSSKRVKLKRLANKKHPDYAGWKKMETVVESAFKSLTSSDNSAFVSKIAPAMEFWKEKESGYSFKDKEGKKLKYASLKNLCLASLYSEDYAAASDYASKIIASKHEEKDGKKLKEEVDKVKATLDKLGRDTRFFAIEVSEDIAAQKEEFKAKRDEKISSGDLTAHPDFDDMVRIKANSTVSPAINYPMGGSEISGFLVYEQEVDGYPDFRHVKKMRFAYMKDDELKVGSPSVAKIDSISVDSRMYRIETVLLGAGIASLKVKNALVYDLKEYKNTILKIVIPPYPTGSVMGQKAELEPELAVFKKSDKKFYSTKAMRGVSKAMEKIVKGCKPAMAVLEAAKKEKKKKGLLSRALSVESDDIIYDCLEAYDECN